jgi:hypothetical protein
MEFSATGIEFASPGEALDGLAQLALGHWIALDEADDGGPHGLLTSQEPPGTDMGGLGEQDDYL